MTRFSCCGESKLLRKDDFFFVLSYLRVTVVLYGTSVWYGMEGGNCKQRREGEHGRLYVYGWYVWYGGTSTVRYSYGGMVVGGIQANALGALAAEVVGLRARTLQRLHFGRRTDAAKDELARSLCMHQYICNMIIIRTYVPSILLHTVCNHCWYHVGMVWYLYVLFIAASQRSKLPTIRLWLLLRWKLTDSNP